jgi:hypothetical protein
MMKMLKDTVATVLVVGAFLVGVASLVQAVSRPWPAPMMASETPEQANTPQAPVHYIITARAN